MLSNVARRPRPLLLALAAVLAAITLLGAGGPSHLAPVLDAANESGVARTISTTGPIDLSNPFFQNLGTNGRACVTCHVASEGWTIVPTSVRARFDRSDGLDPLFRTNDGSNSPNADVSTVEARRSAYSLLLSRGLIRVGMTVPDGAEFVVDAVDDPYGFADTRGLSLFRRPLPSTNLIFLSTLMWDGRETFQGSALHFDLAHQANGATLGHAQAAEALTPEQQRAIVDFESALFTAQLRDRQAGELGAAGADGGPRPLADQPYFPGINSGPDASRRVFTIFDGWAELSGGGALNEARRAVARGQAVFNTRAFAGSFTCSACHNAPNAGSRSTMFFVDLGIAGEARRTPDLPLYTLRCVAANKVIRTTDPGRALVTGRCRDISAFKPATLRALATRAPYFHNGSAASLDDVVRFYDERFAIGFTPVERADLLAFLRSL